MSPWPCSCASHPSHTTAPYGLLINRYVPAEGDAVVGYILDRHAEVRTMAKQQLTLQAAEVAIMNQFLHDATAMNHLLSTTLPQNFVVDIGAPFPALLPQLSFEGATKRNRPNLKPGDAVYARVLSASRDLEPVLTCTDAAGQASGLGQLKEGMMATVDSATARKLLGSKPAVVLEALGSSLEFEVAAGLNGRVWVSAPNLATCVLVSRALDMSQTLTDAQVRVLVAHLLAQHQGQ